MEPANNHWGMQICSLVIFSSVIYALVRYVLFAPNLVEHVPAFIINKALSMAGAIFLVMAAVARARGRFGRGRQLFDFAAFCTIVHVPLSLALLRPGYFGEFFENDLLRLRTLAELTVLFGAISLALMWFVAGRRRTIKERTVAGSVLLLTALAHVSAMGLCRGLNINAQHAYLPPMWLISALVLAVGVFLTIRFYMQEERE